MLKPALVRRNSSIVQAFVGTHQHLEHDHYAENLVNIDSRIKERRKLYVANKKKKPKKGAAKPKSSLANTLKSAEKFKTMTEHKIPLEELYQKFGVDPATGLSGAEALKRNKEHGDNALTEKTKTPWYVKLVKEMVNLFAIMLWAGAALCFVAYALQSSDPSNLYLAIVLIAIVIISGTAAFLQNYKSEAIMEGFKNFIPPKSKVLRDGSLQTIDARKLVPGDIIQLKEGDKIAADFRVIKCTEMRVDNSSLTGESEPLLRSTECTHPDNPLETKNLCFFGTLCKQGTATGIIINIGDNTVIGQIANLAASAETSDETPLQKELNRFVKIIFVLAISMGLLFFCVGFAFHYSVLSNLLNAVGLIVGNAPEGLLVTLTVSLTLGAKRLASKSVLVKNLQSVETLGSTTTICSDKTGTLTQNRMTIENLWFDGKIMKGLNKQKYEREKEKYAGVKLEYDEAVADFKILQEAAVLSSEAVFDVGLPADKQEFINKIQDKSRQEKERDAITKAYKHDLEKKMWMERPVVGDASETAIVKFFQPIEDIADTRTRYPLAKVNGADCRVAFNSTNKFAISIVDYPDKNTNSEYCLYMKGAPERIWKYCNKILIDGKEYPIDDKWRKAFDFANEQFGKGGQRVLGFAMKHLDIGKYPKGYAFNTTVAAKYPDYKEWNFELNGLTFVGLLSLIDPPRDTVPFSIIKCKTAGIKVIMVTGDQPVTAQAIARQVNILDHNLQTNLDLQEELNISAEEAILRAEAIVIHGDLITEATKEDEYLPSKERGKKLAYWLSKKQIVFARTSPAQKLIIVNACQKRGEIVAVTGDGVNDSPAIKQADIGISMGVTGSDVAKDAADIVLLTDDFAALVIGIEEGRKFFDNLKKTISYTLTSNIPELMPFVILVFFRIPLPVTTILLLCISIGTDMFPAISLAYEEAELDIMIRKPRDRFEHLVSKKLLSFCYLQMGMFETFGAFLTYFVIMNDFGFPFMSVIGLGLRDGYRNNETDIHDPTDPYLGNTLLSKADACGPNGNIDDFGYTPDWQFSDDIRTDLRTVYVQCHTENGIKTGHLINTQDWATCQTPIISNITKKPVCYTAEAIKYAQSGYFASIVILQWANLIANKTRRASIFFQGFRNYYQLWGLMSETLFVIIILYIPVLNDVLGTRELIFIQLGTPAVPFALLILWYDEIRKYLIHRSIRDKKEGEKPGWWYRNACW